MNSFSAATAELVSIEEARPWIGRRLILRKPLLGFEAGTRCVVLCVVDFGDGLLLWVNTDDKRAVEVDQMNLGDIHECFRVLPADAPERPLGSLRRVVENSIS